MIDLENPFSGVKSTEIQKIITKFTQNAPAGRILAFHWNRYCFDNLVFLKYYCYIRIFDIVSKYLTSHLVCVKYSWIYVKYHRICVKYPWFCVKFQDIMSHYTYCMSNYMSNNLTSNHQISIHFHFYFFQTPTRGIFEGDFHVLRFLFCIIFEN